LRTSTQERGKKKKKKSLVPLEGERPRHAEGGRGGDAFSSFVRKEGGKKKGRAAGLSRRGPWWARIWGRRKGRSGLCRGKEKKGSIA